MDRNKAYLNRATLGRTDLERLLAAMLDDRARYIESISNYPEERMEKYGKPYLARVDARITDVRDELATR